MRPKLHDAYAEFMEGEKNITKYLTELHRELDTKWSGLVEVNEVMKNLTSSVK